MSSLGCNRDCLRTYARHLNHVLQRNTQHNRKQYYSISLINKTLETNQNMDTFLDGALFIWRKYDFICMRHMVCTPLIISYLSPENHLPVLSSTVRTSFQWNFLTSISVQFYVLAASKDLWYAFSHHIFYMICNIMFLVELKYTQKIFLCFGTTMFVCVCLIFAWVCTRDINESENKHWKRWKFLSNFCVSSFLCSFPFIEKHLQVIAWSTSFHSYPIESAMIMYVY